MANSFTPTYSFTLPEVGADTNAWGGHLNGNFTTIDTQMLSRTLTSAQTMAGALALPSNGLNVGSGQLNVTGGNVSMSGNASAVNGSFSGTLSATGTATLSGNATVGGTLGVTGAATLSSTLAVTGAATFTVPLVASAAPTLGTHLTNKTYVDGLKTTVDAYTITAGTSLTGGGAINTSPTISVATGGITATQLASNAVTTAKITDANVTTAKIADANITAAKLDGAQSGSAPIFGARAWASVANNGTSASLSAGGNIASVSRTAAGTVAVTFTTAMADANYSVAVTPFNNTFFVVGILSSKTASGFTILTNNGSSNVDSAFSVVVFR